MGIVHISRAVFHQPRFGAKHVQAVKQATPMSAPPPMPQDPYMLTAQLGLNTQTLMNGQVLYNEPLVQSLVNCRERAIPALQNFFQSTAGTPQIIEGLQVAARLADAYVPGLEQLYPALTRWNSHPDPTIQMHLARFYRKINEPKTFGPMLATAVNYATLQYSSISMPTAYNVSEEVGATLLDQIARRTAQETVRQLAPYLQTRSFPDSSTPFGP